MLDPYGMKIKDIRRSEFVVEANKKIIEKI